jgi:putative ATPase
MKDLGYGEDYKYAHDFTGHFTPQEYLPPAMHGKTYYIPSDQGHEKTIASRLKNWWGDRKGKP